jgi:hypothetical protein
MMRGFLAGERTLSDHLESTIATAIDNLETATGRWRPAEGTLYARSISLHGTRFVLVTF